MQERIRRKRRNRDRDGRRYSSLARKSLRLVFRLEIPSFLRRLLRWNLTARLELYCSAAISLVVFPRFSISAIWISVSASW